MRFFIFAALLSITTPAIAGTAMADMRNHEAQGTKDCYVWQMNSVYLDALAKQQIADVGVAYGPYVTKVWFKVGRGGSLSIGLRDDAYPGTKLYALIGGKRFAGAASNWLHINSTAEHALDAGKVFAYTYTDWPYGAKHDEKDAFTGFAAAKAECVAFLKR